MLDFQRKRKVRRFLYSKWMLGLLIVIIALLARATYNIYNREALSAAALGEVQNQYDGLTAREGMLNSEIAKLGTDEGVEEEIRSRFSVEKPGETVVMVLNASDTAASGAAGAAPKGFWQRIFGWLWQ